MNQWDNFYPKDRRQSNSVVDSLPPEDWQVNPKVLERNPFIGSNAPKSEITLSRVEYHPSGFKGESDKPISKGFRARFREFYDKDSTQTVVSIIIILNGILYVIQTAAWTKHCCVHNQEAQRVVEWIDFCFLLFYTVELSLNFYAHFFWGFWTKSSWNWFDFIVILGSWIPAQNLAAIRLLRTLRLVRISGRLGPFAFIMKTLRKSMSGVGTLLALLIGFMTIYAVLGVGLFGEESDKFDDFFTAWWTLFITLNGESWPDFSEPLLGEFWYTPVYFGTFIVTVSVIVLNMVIAVFIEKTAEVLRERNIEMRKNRKNGQTAEFNVDPILPSTVEERNGFNQKEVRRCVLQLFHWESKNSISRSQCNHAIQRILTTDGFLRLARPIVEGRLQLVLSLLQSR